MKILFYINEIGGGGAERVMANLANGFSQKGHEVVLVTSFPRENEYFLLETIKRYNLDEKATVRREIIRKNCRRIIKLRIICKKEKCDVAVSFMEGPNFRLIFSALFLNMKTVISLRSDPGKEYQNIFHKVTADFIYNLADACVFQTEEARSFFSVRLQNKSSIILNPVSGSFYKGKISEGTGGIVSVGRLEKTKNFELLIYSFTKIAGEFPNERLVIYGDGPHRQNLNYLITELKMEHKIKLAGKVENVAEKIENAKLFVLSSDYEGMPNALMEAMALGIPAIATDCPCGGPRVLFENEKSGKLVPVAQIKEMSEALRYLLKNPQKRQQLAQNAKKRAEDFRGEKICERWQELFLSLLEKRG